MLDKVGGDFAALKNRVRQDVTQKAHVRRDAENGCIPQGGIHLADGVPAILPVSDDLGDHRVELDGDLVADAVRAVHAMPATALGAHVGRLVTCVGMLTTGKPVHTIKDEPMEVVTFDDGHGLIETVIFPDVYRKVAPLLFGTGPYVMRGKVEESYGAVTLTVTALDRLDRYAQRRNLPWRALSVT